MIWYYDDEHTIIGVDDVYMGKPCVDIYIYTLEN